MSDPQPLPVRVESPQWDNRNQPFISPALLQQFKASTPTHHFTTISNDSDHDNMQVAQQRPNTGNSINHGRSSSFFSFRKQTSSASEVHRSPSLNGRSRPEQQQVQQQPIQPPPPQPQPQEPSTSSPPFQSQSQSTSSPSQPQPLQQAQLHPEIRSVVQLNAAQAHKIYQAGRLIRRVERDPNGHRPTKDEGWTEVWAQLGGTTLSIWDMKAINEASRQGKEVPPTYINVTDAFVQVLGAITIPIPGSATTERHENVLTLNTAGSNLLFFACPDTTSLISWASALRLSSWEKSRLEEVYTAHLIRITLSARDIPTTLNRGKLEGWVRVRIAGQTDWKSLWMVIHEASDNQPDELGRVPSNNGPAAHPTANTAAGRMKRMSNLFSPKDHGATGTAFQKPTVVVYASPKPKDRKKPILTVNDITQAFAVYPERPELITRSTLIKLEGSLGAEELAGGMRGRQGWLLLMPQSEGNLSPAAEMLKWVIALHDAFKLYGRPQAWTWDPRAPNSLMFAYPVGPHKDLLFLAREQAEKFDPREERTSVIRSRYIDLLNETMQQSDPARPPQQPQQRAPVANPPSRGYQLPPLSFDRTDQQQDRHLLTPITERSSIYTHGISISGDAATLATKPSMKTTNGDPSGVTEVIPEEPRTPPVASNGDNPLDNVIIGPNGRPSIDEGASPPPPPNKDGFDRTASARSTTGSQYNEPTNMSLAVEKSTGRSSLDVPGNANNVNVIRSGSPLGSPVRKPASILSNGTADQKPQSPGSPSVSSIPLRSPHSPSLGGGGPLLERSATPSGSVLTSPYSPTPSMKQGSPSPTKSTFSFAPSASFATVSRNSSASASMGGTAMPISAGAAAVPAGTKGVGGLSNEAGALHYMQHGGGGGGSGGRMPATIAETDMDGDDGDDSSAEFSGPPGQTQDSARPVVTAINTAGRPSYADSVSPVVRQGTPMAFVERAGGGMNDRPNPSGSAESPPIVNAASANSSPSRPGVLGRKPSGARAQVNNSRMNITGNVESVTSSSATHPQPQRRPPQAIQEEMGEDTHTTTSAPLNVSSPKKDLSRSMTVTTDDSSLDVLAALSYLDVTDPSQDQFGVEKLEEPVAVKPVQPLRTNRTSSASPPPAQLPGPVKSSFAPSNKAAERKAKVQAQQAAAAAAASRPGRAGNGKRKMRSAKAYAGAWSSDEEEDEEDEDEEEGNEEVDSDGEPTSKPASGMNSSNTSVKPPLEGGDPYDSFHQQQGPAHLRPARNLPQIPAGRSQDEPLPPRRSQLEPQYTQHAQMSPQQYPQIPRSNYFEDNTPIRTQEHPQPGAARQQNIWSHVLDPGHTPGEASPSNTRDTFVQIEPPSQTMTKAFTPQGLLSAGIQDKQGRSAKRQEELARESGASLINVPNKPPPPQTGLLGAITAHERERKRDGGVGAALTEREREKRLAEERQRRFDDAQRQQLDQMQQGGSMYGNQFGMNPMMMGMGMNPMSMMGMNPMMTGGMNPMMTGGGMNPMMSQYGMMGGLNPQHMYAAQQAAAQAYQQAMMAFSTAGSQPGGDGPNGNMNGGSPSLNPMMAGGNMMGGMGGMGGMGVGFDPRMSMMMVNPMSMQMTGMSQFDPRFPPQNTGGTPSPMNELPSSLLPLGGLGGNPAPGSSSPARHGSPLARPNDTPDSGARGSRPTSPKPQ